MMLVVAPTGVGDGLVVLPADEEGGPGTPFVGVDDGLGDGDGDGDGGTVTPVAPLAPVGPVGPTGVGDGVGSGLGEGEGAPVAPLALLVPLGPVLDVVVVSPDATAGTTMYIRANIKSVAVSNPRVPDLILR